MYIYIEIYVHIHIHVYSVNGFPIARARAQGNCSSLLDGKLQEFRNAGRAASREKGRDQRGSVKLAAYSISKWPIATPGVVSSAGEPHRCKPARPTNGTARAPAFLINFLFRASTKTHRFESSSAVSSTSRRFSSISSSSTPVRRARGATAPEKEEEGEEEKEAKRRCAKHSRPGESSRRNKCAEIKVCRGG